MAADRESNSNQKIRTSCPACSTRYKVASTMLGRSVRCSQCETQFRVKPVKPATNGTGSETRKTPSLKRPPTEDDILRWLTEAREEEDFAEPREHRGDRTPVEDRNSDKNTPMPASPSRNRAVQTGDRAIDPVNETIKKTG